jgi:hypothetical protein
MAVVSSEPITQTAGSVQGGAVRGRGARGGPPPRRPGLDAQAGAPAARPHRRGRRVARARAEDPAGAGLQRAPRARQRRLPAAARGGRARRDPRAGRSAAPGGGLRLRGLRHRHPVPRGRARRRRRGARDAAVHAGRVPQAERRRGAGLGRALRPAAGGRRQRRRHQRPPDHGQPRRLRVRQPGPDRSGPAARRGAGHLARRARRLGRQGLARTRRHATWSRCGASVRSRSSTWT